jgi:hypothetical protein
MEVGYWACALRGCPISSWLSLLSHFPFFLLCALLVRYRQECSAPRQNRKYIRVANFGPSSSSPGELTDSVRTTPYIKTLGETHMFVIACSIPFNMQSYFESESSVNVLLNNRKQT